MYGSAVGVYIPNLVLYVGVHILGLILKCLAAVNADPDTITLLCNLCNSISVPSTYINISVSWIISWVLFL